MTLERGHVIPWCGIGEILGGRGRGSGEMHQSLVLSWPHLFSTRFSEADDDLLPLSAGRKKRREKCRKAKKRDDAFLLVLLLLLLLVSAHPAALVGGCESGSKAKLTKGGRERVWRMESASCFCGFSVAASAAAGGTACIPRKRIASLSLSLPLPLPVSARHLPIRCSSNSNNSTKASSPPFRPTSPPILRKTAVIRRKKEKGMDGNPWRKSDRDDVAAGQGLPEDDQEPCIPSSLSVGTLYQNGDPLGRRELGKPVVRWISQGMRAMASDLANAEVQGEFSELRQRMGMASPPPPNGNSCDTGGLAFVIQAQPYLYAVPMPKGLEAICFKACTHYPTLFDHFQRELRDILQDLQRQSVFPDWRGTDSWKLLKEFASSSNITFPVLPLAPLLTSSCYAFVEQMH